MIIEERTANFAASEGKFFQVVDRTEEGVETFRQLECYMPAAVSTYKEPLEATRSRFLAELESIRQQHYAMDYEEFEEHMVCMAAPIFDHLNTIIAAVSISFHCLVIKSAK